MASSSKPSPIKRQYLGKTGLNLPHIDFAKIPKDSYQWFLDAGIQKAFNNINPVEDFTGKNWELSFGKHKVGAVNCTPGEALKKGLNYDAPLQVETRLVNKRTGDITKQEVFMGDIPLMTDRGTFIINGIERAVVNQLVRSPGVFFTSFVDTSSGKKLHSAEIRPIRGSWLEFVINRYGVLTVKIDRRRKFPATVLLKAIGLDDLEAIKKIFADVDTNEAEKYIDNTLAKDNTKDQIQAAIEIYSKLRPGEPAVADTAKQLVENLFFNSRRYNLGEVGRYKINTKLDLDIDNIEANWVLTPEDIIATIKYLIGLQNGVGKVDDIDHLANRRLRSVGELVVDGPFRIGLLRLERAIKEKMTLTSTDDLVLPNNLVNARPIIATVNEFFRSSQLSTILDQTNPLAEIDNIRRVTVMGIGGVSRERASFSIRDINTSQYSRICPVRSPEGPNIGLVTYLAMYARVNRYGFLEAPYRKVEKLTRGGQTKMRVTNQIEYLTAAEEEKYHLTHAEVNIDKNGYITDKWVPIRHNGEFTEGPVEAVEYIDVVSRQVVGVSASLIPFLNHDEASRALMGTHMQCQAIPLIKPQSALIGTGMETQVSAAMGRVVKARHAGRVIFVDGTKVVIKVNKSAVKSKLKNTEFIELKGQEETYFLSKFQRTAQSTCYSQKPLVSVGDTVNAGDLIIDGPASENGEIALGQNLKIAYMSFEGLGYEDAIVISDRLVKDDTLTSVNIEEYDAQVVETKLGPEELTRDIPNVSEHDLRNLTESGIVSVGAEVGPNDILVGKIAPKGETELTAEERLLRAIFGEKAREVRDTSLRMPHGQRGTVIDIQIFDREAGDEMEAGTNKKVIVRVAQMRKITVGDKLAGRHGNKGVISKIVPAANMPYTDDGEPIDIILDPMAILKRMNLGQILETHLGWAAAKLGKKYACPVFENVSEDFIIDQMQQAGLSVDGKTYLYDGRTGEKFHQPTVVGTNYIMKLNHMVEDKTHARSTGPYSLVTQQPLGGKAQMGGQRLGEMEVWALEAHRAAYTLQEMLTIKSDDVIGRAKAFEAIVKGDKIPEATVPESFKVLVKELNSLAVNVIPKQAVISDTPENQDAQAVETKKTDGNTVSSAVSGPKSNPDSKADTVETTLNSDEATTNSDGKPDPDPVSDSSAKQESAKRVK